MYMILHYLNTVLVLTAHLLGVIKILYSNYLEEKVLSTLSPDDYGLVPN